MPNNYISPFRQGPSNRVLVHFDGANGSSAGIVDQYGRTLTVNGTVVCSNTYAKFGLTSGLFQGGANDFIEIPNDNDLFNLGNDDFTIDSWLLRTSAGMATGEEVPWGTFQWQTGFRGGFRLQLTPSDMNFCAFSAYPVVTAGMALPLGVLTHVAVTRQGNVFRIFVGGVKRGEVVNADPIIMPAYHSPVMRLGAIISDGAAIAAKFVGYQDEFNFIRGQALYTADFTPPSAPY